MIKKLALAIAIAAIFATGSIAYAEDKGEWSIQLEPMWMDVSGNDVHVGDVLKGVVDWYYNGVTGTYTRKYGITYEPITLNMKDKLTLRSEITYKKNQWGLGLSGWWFNTDASAGGRVTTPKWTEGTDGINHWGTYSKNGVRMWDSSIGPVYNDLEASTYSPVDYQARNDLDVWTVDLFGIRTLAEKKDSHIDMTFGLKLGSLDNDRNEGQKMRAYCTNCYIDVLNDVVDKWDNYITLESVSKADYGLMAGPALGLQGKAKYRGVGLEGMLNQSLLIGRVKQSGTWTDIDDIELVYYGTPYEGYIEGKFPFSKKETHALPVTEAKLKFLFDVTRNVSVGIGGFASIWWNAPVAPKWSIPGDWTEGEGTGWKLQKNTLVFYGGTLALNVMF